MTALSSIDARVKLLCLTCYFVAALNVRTLAGCGLCLVLALVCACAVRLGWQRGLKVLVPLAPIVALTCILQVFTIQTGQVLVQLGGVAVTDDALVTIVRMVVCLASIMLMSMSFMRCTRVEELVDVLEWCLGPLRRAGVHVEGLMFSLAVAFRFMPVFVGEFQQLRHAQEARLAAFDGGVRASLKAYTRLFAPLLRSAFRRADLLAESAVSRCFGCGATLSRCAFGKLGLRECCAIVLTLAFVACTIAL